ncbi:MAG TPA: POTRA domain-containing protein [Vulgatibacter sp.]|nr:POTRA domain-containing protein [Vulgatibacter sp.]
MRAIASLALLALALGPWTGCASTSAAREGPAGNQPKVASVEIEGNQAVGDGLIADRIATQASNRFLFFGSEKRLDPGALDQDRRRIESVYADNGYFAAEVSVRVIAAGADEVDVVFQVEEGPPTLVRSLTILGLEGLPEASVAKILQAPPLSVGRIFVEADYLGLKEQIVSRLEERGHATAKAEGTVEIAPEEGSADVVIVVEPGPVYRFGEIRVEGNLLVSAETIEEAAKVVLEPGDRFSPAKIAEAEEEVASLGVFASSIAAPGEPDPETGTLPVDVFVSEADFIRIRAGGGFGVEQGFEQVRGLLDFTHLDLFGNLEQFTLRNDIAYRFLFSESRSGIGGRSIADLTQLDFIGPRVDLSVRAEYERELNLSFTSQSVAGRVGTPIRFRHWLFFTPSYNLQRFFDVSVFDPGTLAGVEAVRASPLVDCPSGCTFSYLEQRLIGDRRSDPLEPRWGWYASLGLQEGGSILGGDFTWIRFVPELRWYAPISPSVIFATRLQLGILQPLDVSGACDESEDPYSQAVDCSPIVVRFFGGGAAGFRGVGAGRLSPLREAQETKRNGKTTTVFVPLGGNSSSLATAETRWMFAQRWTAVFFVDAANVAAGPTDAFDPSDLFWAAGVGLRYRTPIGPARFDAGYRFLHRHLEVVNGTASFERGFFRWFAFFLSIGEAF